MSQVGQTGATSRANKGVKLTSVTGKQGELLDKVSRANKVRDRGGDGSTEIISISVNAGAHRFVVL